MKSEVAQSNSYFWPTQHHLISLSRLCPLPLLQLRWLVRKRQGGMVARGEAPGDKGSATTATAKAELAKNKDLIGPLQITLVMWVFFICKI